MVQYGITIKKIQAAYNAKKCLVSLTKHTIGLSISLTCKYKEGFNICISHKKVNWQRRRASKHVIFLHSIVNIS